LPFHYRIHASPLPDVRVAPFQLTDRCGKAGNRNETLVRSSTRMVDPATLYGSKSRWQALTMLCEWMLKSRTPIIYSHRTSPPMLRSKRYKRPAFLRVSYNTSSSPIPLSPASLPPCSVYSSPMSLAPPVRYEAQDRDDAVLRQSTRF
jgi:hypothetical protein